MHCETSCDLFIDLVLWLHVGSPIGTLWSTRLACCIDGVHRLDVCFTHNVITTVQFLLVVNPWFMEGTLGGLISSLERTFQK